MSYTKSLTIGILAHVDAGKTSLTECLLYAAGVTTDRGSVDQGSAITDGLAMEKSRGISIKTATVDFVWQDTQVNIVDTPGHVVGDRCSSVSHLGGRRHASAYHKPLGEST